jgi:hypothetical protein
MFFFGIALIAGAVVVLLMAMSRRGVLKQWATKPLLGEMVAVGITGAGAVGVILMINGLGRF